jgi:hypothetical protein
MKDERIEISPLMEDVLRSILFSLPEANQEAMAENMDNMFKRKEDDKGYTKYLSDKKDKK